MANLKKAKQPWPDVEIRLNKKSSIYTYQTRVTCHHERLRLLKKYKARIAKVYEEDAKKLVVQSTIGFDFGSCGEEGNRLEVQSTLGFDFGGCT
eukprot:1879584-Amphidinium_carterae.1